jgi:rhamnosyltransferase
MQSSISVNLDTSVSSESSVQSESVCAVVVAYYPDADFEARLLRILPQVSMLVIVDNTPAPLALSADFREHWQERLHCIANTENMGIAAALNQGLAYADHMAYPWMLTLDQDTLCYPDMVDILGNVHAACSPAPAVIGSNYFDPQNARAKIKVDESLGWLDQTTVITSGCLVNTAAAQQLGGFREDYFIDQVDHEFCIRVRSHGGRVVISTKPAMDHSVGRAGGARLPWLGVLPNHPPVRKYYIARNTIVTVASYWKTEPAWCFRRLVRLFLGLIEMAVLEEQRGTKVRAFMAGIFDGVRAQMGPCRRKFLQPKSST